MVKITVLLLQREGQSTHEFDIVKPPLLHHSITKKVRDKTFSYATFLHTQHLELF